MKNYLIPIDENHAKNIIELCREVMPICCFNGCDKDISKDDHIFYVEIDDIEIGQEQINNIATLCEKHYFEYMNCEGLNKRQLHHHNISLKALKQFALWREYEE